MTIRLKRSHDIKENQLGFLENLNTSRLPTKTNSRIKISSFSFERILRRFQVNAIVSCAQQREKQGYKILDLIYCPNKEAVIVST
jgi:hypothetical protein